MDAINLTAFYRILKSRSKLSQQIIYTVEC